MKTQNQETHQNRHRNAIAVAAILSSVGIGVGVWYATRKNEKARAEVLKQEESNAPIAAIIGIVAGLVSVGIFLSAYYLLRTRTRKKRIGKKNEAPVNKKPPLVEKTKEQSFEDTGLSSIVKKIEVKFTGDNPKVEGFFRNKGGKNTANFGNALALEFAPKNVSSNPQGLYNDSQIFLFDPPTTTETLVRNLGKTHSGGKQVTEQENKDMQLMWKNDMANHELLILEAKIKALKFLGAIANNMFFKIEKVVKNIKALELAGSKFSKEERQQSGYEELRENMLYYLFAVYMLAFRFLKSTDKVALEAKMSQVEREKDLDVKGQPKKVNGYIGEIDAPAIDTAIIESDGKISFLNQTDPIEEAIKKEKNPRAKNLLKLTRTRRAAYYKQGNEFREVLENIITTTKPFALEYEKLDPSETEKEPPQYQKNTWTFPKEKLHLEYPFELRNAFTKFKKKHEKLAMEEIIETDQNGPEESVFSPTPLEVR
jgi:hypothetical protein